MKQVFEDLKDEFKLTTVSNYKFVNQNGNFLIFSGMDFPAPNTKVLNFDVVIARNTLENDVYALLDEVENLEKHIFEYGVGRYRKNVLKKLKQIFITSELFAYILNVEVEVKRA